MPLCVSERGSQVICGTAATVTNDDWRHQLQMAIARQSGVKACEHTFETPVDGVDKSMAYARGTDSAARTLQCAHQVQEQQTSDDVII
jgi:predicted kinase